MPRLSITRRVIVSVLLTELVLTIAVVAFATYMTLRQLKSGFDASLHGRAMSIAALVRFSEDVPPHLVFDSSLVPPPLDPNHPDVYEILAADGYPITRSPNWPTRFSSRPGRDHWTAPVNHGEYRVVRLKTPVLDQEGPNTATSATITVIYAASTEEIRERAWAVTILTCLGSLLLLGISTAATVWAVRRGLSPLSELAASAGCVTAADWTLHAPEPARGTVELAPLTAAMDTMLVTLQQAFTAQREFVANAAHELKTPIAVLKSTLQQALQRPRTAEEYRHRLQDALDDVARLETLTHSMLRLARAEQMQTAKRRDDLPLVDLAASCEQSLERWRPVAEGKSVRIGIQALDTPRVHGDWEDFELIWNNLLDNAIRYSPRDSEVVVQISADDHQARVDVRDNGPGIGETDLQNIFNRFHRADASRSRQTGGYGLGLAIVKAMVEAYGGSIVAESQAGTGTTMSVRLPQN